MTKNTLLIAIAAGLFATTGAYAQTSNGNSSTGVCHRRDAKRRFVRRRFRADEKTQDAQAHEPAVVDRPVGQPEQNAGRRNGRQRRDGERSKQVG